MQKIIKVIIAYTIVGALLSITLLLLFASCSKTEVEESDTVVINDINKTNLETKSECAQRSYEVSQAEANSYMLSLWPNKHYDVTPIIDGVDTLIYLYNSNDGWVMISGDKRSNPILGKSFGARLSVNSLENENLKFWINLSKSEIKHLRESNEGENENTIIWRKLTRANCDKESVLQSRSYKYVVNHHLDVEYLEENDVVPHLIQTQWGQGYPWNYKCPYDSTYIPVKRCVTGCTAVAMSQLLYYTHNHLGVPTGLYHTITASSYIWGPQTNIGFSRGDYYSVSSRWSNMALTSGSYTGSTDYVGDLMLDVGNRVNMNYSSAESGAWPQLSALQNYSGLTGQEGNYNFSTVYNSLQSYMPVIIVGWNSGETEGHTWLIDGIHRTRIHYSETITFEYDENWMFASEYYDTFDELRQRYNINSLDDIQVFHDAHITTHNYYLMNWGYDGSHDTGWYSLDAAGDWLNYNNNLHIYYGFESVY